MKKALLGVAAAAALLALIAISLKAYYVVIAIVVGGLLIFHRELWSLLTTGHLPPFDERVKENTGRAVRNGFLFFAGAAVCLMLVFSMDAAWKPDLVDVLGGLFIATGAAYLLSYLFFDRAEPNLSQRGLTMLKGFLITAGSAVAVFILGVFLHNLVSALFDIEEAVFFTIATIIAPLGLATGLIGSLVVFIKGLASQRQ